MDQIPFQGDSGDLQEWQDWATEEMDRLRERILELEERLLDTDKITTHEIARLKRALSWRTDLVSLAIKVAERRRARILELESLIASANVEIRQQRRRVHELEDQLVDARLEPRLKDVQNQKM